jgi:hypothetical protein
MSIYDSAKAAVRCMARSWIQDINGAGVRSTSSVQAAD